MTLPDLPTPWALTHLILLDPDWQVNLSDGEHVAVGTGETPAAAVLNAFQKAEAEQYIGRLFHLAPLPPMPGEGILALLNLTPPKPLPRRKINAL